MLEIQVTIKAPELAGALEKLADAMKPHEVHFEGMRTSPGFPDGILPPVANPSAQMAAVGQAAAQGFQPPVAPQASAPAMPPAPPVVPQAPASAAVPTTAPDYTQDQLSRAASTFLDKAPANLAQLRGLLQQFGVQAVSQLATPEARTAFANALRGLGAQV